MDEGTRVRIAGTERTGIVVGTATYRDPVTYAPAVSGYVVKLDAGDWLGGRTGDPDLGDVYVSVVVVAPDNVEEV